MKYIMWIFLIALSSTSWGKTSTHAGNMGVITTFDYKAKNYNQTLSIEELNQTKGFNPLSDSIDLKAFANAALKKAHELDPENTLDIESIYLHKLSESNVWYISVALAEPITSASQMNIHNITFIFSVSGLSAKITEE